MEVNLERIAAAIASEARSQDAKAKSSGAETQMPTATGNQDNVTTTSSKALKRCLSVPIPRSQPTSREVSPAPVFNIFAPRGRRYSASYSPARGIATVAGSSGNNGTNTGQSSRCVTPRISQLRQEECVDGLNSREVNHEREVHSAIQISQSWEDLSLVAENWSCKSSEELSNPLQVVVAGSLSGNCNAGCSSPSPTNNRANLRLPYGLSPSPTRRSTTFATRRSMSPIAIRPSQLGPVKRKFELDETTPTSSTWNSLYSQPPSKKMFCESRGSSPICQSPSGSVCPSPDSGTGTYDGRITPKLLISKLYTHNATSMNTNNANSSACSSPMSASSYSGDVIDTASAASTHLCSSSSSSNSSSSLANSTASNNSEPMSLSSLDEGISLNDKILGEAPMSTSTLIPAVIQDESTLMDIIKPTHATAIDECTNMVVENTGVGSAMDDKM
ncbi:uncharacterized protein LOC142222129 [Haematobia irritans]|uniref:uncharacterized protein LOC142222129 n=1 Tax=Haematobia irritans TaxID=7368 RepID=UPI003F50C4A1